MKQSTGTLSCDLPRLDPLGFIICGVRCFACGKSVGFALKCDVVDGVRASVVAYEFRVAWRMLSSECGHAATFVAMKLTG